MKLFALLLLIIAVVEAKKNFPGGRSRGWTANKHSSKTINEGNGRDGERGGQLAAILVSRFQEIDEEEFYFQEFDEDEILAELPSARDAHNLCDAVENAEDRVFVKCAAMPVGGGLFVTPASCMRAEECTKSRIFTDVEPFYRDFVRRDFDDFDPRFCTGAITKQTSFGEFTLFSTSFGEASPDDLAPPSSFIVGSEVSWSGFPHGTFESEDELAIVTEINDFTFRTTADNLGPVGSGIFFEGMPLGIQLTENDGLQLREDEECFTEPRNDVCKGDCGIEFVFLFPIVEELFNVLFTTPEPPEFATLECGESFELEHLFDSAFFTMTVGEGGSGPVFHEFECSEETEVTIVMFGGEEISVDCECHECGRILADLEEGEYAIGIFADRTLTSVQVTHTCTPAALECNQPNAFRSLGSPRIPFQLERSSVVMLEACKNENSVPETGFFNEQDDFVEAVYSGCGVPFPGDTYGFTVAATFANGTHFLRANTEDSFAFDFRCLAIQHTQQFSCSNKLQEFELEENSAVVLLIDHEVTSPNDHAARLTTCDSSFQTEMHVFRGEELNSAEDHYRVLSTGTCESKAVEVVLENDLFVVVVTGAPGQQRLLTIEYDCSSPVVFCNDLIISTAPRTFNFSVSDRSIVTTSEGSFFGSGISDNFEFFVAEEGENFFAFGDEDDSETHIICSAPIACGESQIFSMNSDNGHAIVTFNDSDSTLLRSFSISATSGGVPIVDLEKFLAAVDFDFEQEPVFVESPEDASMPFFNSEALVFVAPEVGADLELNITQTCVSTADSSGITSGASLGCGDSIELNMRGRVGAIQISNFESEGVALRVRVNEKSSVVFDTCKSLDLGFTASLLVLYEEEAFAAGQFSNLIGFARGSEDSCNEGPFAVLGAVLEPGDYVLYITHQGFEGEPVVNLEMKCLAAPNSPVIECGQEIEFDLNQNEQVSFTYVISSLDEQIHSLSTRSSEMDTDFAVLDAARTVIFESYSNEMTDSPFAERLFFIDQPGTYTVIIYANRGSGKGILKHECIPIVFDCSFKSLFFESFQVGAAQTTDEFDFSQFSQLDLGKRAFTINVTVEDRIFIEDNIVVFDSDDQLVEDDPLPIGVYRAFFGTFQNDNEFPLFCDNGYEEIELQCEEPVDIELGPTDIFGVYIGTLMEVDFCDSPIRPFSYVRGFDSPCKFIAQDEYLEFMNEGTEPQRVKINATCHTFTCGDIIRGGGNANEIALTVSGLNVVEFTGCHPESDTLGFEFVVVSEEQGPIFFQDLCSKPARLVMADDDFQFLVPFTGDPFSLGMECTPLRILDLELSCDEANTTTVSNNEAVSFQFSRGVEEDKDGNSDEEPDMIGFNLCGSKFDSVHVQILNQHGLVHECTNCFTCNDRRLLNQLPSGEYTVVLTPSVVDTNVDEILLSIAVQCRDHTLQCRDVVSGSTGSNDENEEPSKANNLDFLFDDSIDSLANDHVLFLNLTEATKMRFSSCSETNFDSRIQIYDVKRFNVKAGEDSFFPFKKQQREKSHQEKNEESEPNSNTRRGSTSSSSSSTRKSGNNKNKNKNQKNEDQKETTKSARENKIAEIISKLKKTKDQDGNQQQRAQQSSQPRVHQHPQSRAHRHRGEDKVNKQSHQVKAQAQTQTQKQSQEAKSKSSKLSFNSILSKLKSKRDANLQTPESSTQTQTQEKRVHHHRHQVGLKHQNQNQNQRGASKKVNKVESGENTQSLHNHQNKHQRQQQEQQQQQQSTSQNHLKRDRSRGYTNARSATTVMKSASSSSSSSSSMLNTMKQLIQNHKSEKKSQQHQSSSIKSNRVSRKSVRKIVGGEEAGDDEFLFIASLQTTDGFHFCGGSYIGKNLILTASHCVEDTEPQDIQVVLGIRRLSDENTPIRVARIYMHPQYDSDTNDIAILRLIEVPENIPAIPLISNTTLSLEEFPTIATVAGWGALEEGGEGPDQLMKVEVPMQPVVNCSNAYEGYDPEVMICAGFDEGGKDSCQGDSGGPLIAGNPPQLIGIVSFGDGCARPGLYGVYSRVSNLLDFVSQFTEADVDTCDPEIPEYLGDGYCDDGELNHIGCNFDEGDCCTFSCVSSEDYECGFNGYSCLDPDHETIIEFEDDDGCGVNGGGFNLTVTIPKGEWVVVVTGYANKQGDYVMKVECPKGDDVAPPPTENKVIVRVSSTFTGQNLDKLFGNDGKLTSAASNSLKSSIARTANVNEDQVNIISATLGNTKAQSVNVVFEVLANSGNAASSIANSLSDSNSLVSNINNDLSSVDPDILVQDVELDIEFEEVIEEPDDGGDDDDDDDTDKIIGGVVGGVGGAILLTAASVFVWQKMKSQPQTKQTKNTSKIDDVQL